MMNSRIIITIGFSYIISSIRAYDPDALQDLCVADKSHGTKLNGFPCKETSNITSSDLFVAGISKPAKIPGLNTLSVSLARIDYAPGGLNPPHTHPRTTEGELEVGGLVHFQKNNGKSPASVLSAFNSQLPGTVSVAAMLFAAEPALPEDVLTKTFQLGSKMVDKIKDMLATKKSFK
ncbi:hypothetical protein BRARA_I05579 [Brassica rapa]|uniref:Cupin type-1 domain-containing protein n=1 Tax=Brassica campestris TaxID=3711 RepID=A0A397Y7B9_BRACM|nr:hypothetical protein BRARA_I05579 [Brassica rapa]